MNLHHLPDNSVKSKKQENMEEGSDWIIESTKQLWMVRPSEPTVMNFLSTGVWGRIYSRVLPNCREITILVHVLLLGLTGVAAVLKTPVGDVLLKMFWSRCERFWVWHKWWSWEAFFFSSISRSGGEIGTLSLFDLRPEETLKYLNLETALNSCYCFYLHCAIEEPDFFNIECSVVEALKQTFKHVFQNLTT